MDILVSSNLERLLYLLSGDDKLIADLMKQLSENGEYEVPADMLEKLHELFWAGFCDDEGAKTAIGKVWKDDHYLCDTHTAVARRGAAVQAGKPRAQRRRRALHCLSL